MTKKWMTCAAVLCCALMAVLFTACKKSKNNPTGDGGSVQGIWYADVSGKTFAKWNYGATWQKSEFNADGTGSTAIYYVTEDEAFACEKDTFTYTASDGILTMMFTKGNRIVTTGYTADKNTLQLSDDRLQLSYSKMTGEMEERFSTWSRSEDIIDVPAIPAKHTVFVYGNAGGLMDNIIEFGFWETARSFLTDSTNVRVACLYKYGKDMPEEGSPFSGQYAAPGDIVWFELDSQTELDKIKESGMQAIGLGDVAKAMKICDPNTLRAFLTFSSLYCPAEKYSLAIWGHGSGFNPMTDVPGKYDIYQAQRRAPQGVISDEWNEDEQLNMYELHDALKAAGFNHLNVLMFHNCMMGNLETLMEVRDCAEYICASSHVLISGGEVLTEFVRSLAERGDAEEAAAQMFERITPEWQNSYNDDPDEPRNGDYKLIRTAQFMPVIDVIKRLADRLVALYPTQQEAIDKATRQVYRIEEDNDEYNIPFYDVADYAHQLAAETGDAGFVTIAGDLDRAFDDAFVHYRDVSWSKQHLDHYTLSISLMSAYYYTYDYKSESEGILDANMDEGYEQSGFHKATGWGNWLRMNKQFMDSNPCNGGGGPLQ